MALRAECVFVVAEMNNEHAHAWTFNTYNNAYSTVLITKGEKKGARTRARVRALYRTVRPVLRVLYRAWCTARRPSPVLHCVCASCPPYAADCKGRRVLVCSDVEGMLSIVRGRAQRLLAGADGAPAPAAAQGPRAALLTYGTL